jgi:plastocyanin
MARTRVGRAAPLLLLAAAVAASAGAEVLTLQAVASLRGLNPFFSDVRVFNTSYSDTLTVDATYRCFLGPCPDADPLIHFVLAPRESRAFNDIVASVEAFAAHDTGGGIEFEYSGPPGQLVVTSRLYSTEPFDSVGMFIPALPSSRAYASSVLASIRHDAPNSLVAGFRTNVGLFNPGSSSADATIAIFDSAGSPVGTPLIRTVPPHSGLQVSGVFEASGAAEVTTSNATVVVDSSAPLFTYAAVLDNRTADPIFVIGANNAAGAVTPSATPIGPTATRTPTAPPGAPTSTRTKTPMGAPSPTRTSTPPGATMTPTVPGPSATPTQPGPSATPTVTAPGTTSTLTPTKTVPPTITRTPTPSGTIHDVTISNFVFTPPTLTIAPGDSVRWTWSGGTHSTTSGPCPGGVCMDDGNWDSMIKSSGTFTHSFPAAGTFPYHCDVHGAMMQGTITVTP